MNQEFRRFGLPMEWESFFNRHEQFFERYNNLRDAMETAFIRSYIPTAVVDNVVFYCGRLCVEDFLEILLLCGNGYGNGGQKLLRGMFERAVTARYLHQNPEEAENFMDFYWVTQEKLARVFDETIGTEFRDEGKRDEIRKNFEKVKGKFQVTNCKKCRTKRLNHTWTKLDFVTMAQKIPTLREHLAAAYYLPTTQIHSTPGAILSRLIRRDGAVTFQEGAQHEEADRTLILAHNFILNMLELQATHFKLDSLAKKFDVCRQDFLEVWEKQ